LNDPHPGHPDVRFVGLTLNEKASPKKMYQELVIEQIRELAAWQVISAQNGDTKVAVIEPAHLLTVSAANALLKTLEEPVPGRYLILVSDQPHRLPATIRSRCQRIELKLPTREEALAWLLAQGVTTTDAERALDAQSGHPGLALREVREGGAKLRQEVQADLGALAAGRERSHAVAPRWQGDRLAERLQLAAELVRIQLHDQACSAAGAGAKTRWVLGDLSDARALCGWFDQVNRVRGLLRTTLRQDLLLDELLRSWAHACRRGEQNAKMRSIDRIDHHRG
jgi:DNA polymerase-3 subunit delta'